MTAREIALAVLTQHASAWHCAATETQREKVLAAAIVALEPRSEIIGELTRAGTMIITGEPPETGLFIAMTIDELRGVKHLPMYQRVTVTPL